jgi:hypothetical protein
MDFKEFEKNALLIFTKAERNECSFFFDVAQARPTRLKWDAESSVLLIDEGKPNRHIQLSDEQVELLRALFHKVAAHERDAALRSFENGILGEGNFGPWRGHCFAVVAREKGLRRAFQIAFIEDEAFHLNPGRLAQLSDFIRFESYSISDPDLEMMRVHILERLELHRHSLPLPASPSTASSFLSSPASDSSWEARASAQNEYSVFNWIRGKAEIVVKQMEEVLYLRLRDKLREQSNFEVNQDRERLIKEFSQLGYDPQIIDFLERAERDFSIASDDFDFKTSIDQTRSAFEVILYETSVKIAGREGVGITSKVADPKRASQVREYLHKSGFFTSEFRDLVKSFYSVMSEDGTHSIAATKESARIARNICIEICLWVVRRLQTFKSSI